MFRSVISCLLLLTVLCVNVHNSTLSAQSDQSSQEMKRSFSIIRSYESDGQFERAIEEGEVEIDNEKYHLSGIEYVAKRYQDMFYAGRDIYYFKGIGGHGMTDLLRNAIDDLLDTISSREAYRSAEHKMYAQMNQLTEAGAMISLAIELLTSNIRHSYGEINFERYPRPVEVEGEDKH